MIPDLDRIEEKASMLEHSKDVVMQQSRELIRAAGKAIAFMHAYGPAKAKKAIAGLRALNAKLSKAEPGLEYYAIQAHQEYTEAIALYFMLMEKRIPSMDEIGEAEIPYLLGLMDVIGELKRESIESIRKGKLEDAKSYYAIMSDIYDSTLHMRFANSILPDFRRKQDVARIQLESVMNEMLHISQEQHRML